MAIKLKTRDPKTTDFKKDDVVININNVSLFYKSNLGLHKLEPTNIVETPSILKESITITKTSESTEFGNSLDDTHHFSGSISASGNISASGDIFAKTFTGIFQGALSSSVQISDAISGS